MIVFFDIDSTLLNTRKYANTIFSQIQKVLGTDPQTHQQLIDEYYQTLKSSAYFDPAKLTDFLIQYAKNSHGITDIHELQGLRKKVMDFWNNPELAQDCMYSDVTRTIEQLLPRSVLGIFSQGVPNFQSRKLSLMGINHHFEQKNCFIKSSKSSPEAVVEFSKLYEQQSPVILVDDRLDFLLPYQQLQWVTLLHLQRDQTSNQTSNQATIQATIRATIQTIASLDEVSAYV